MKLIDGCYSLKLECALRGLGFVDVGKWKTVARAGIFFVEPIGIPEDPDADLLGFLVTIPYASWKRPRLKDTAKKALDYCLDQYPPPQYPPPLDPEDPLELEEPLEELELLDPLEDEELDELDDELDELLDEELVSVDDVLL